MANGKFLSRGEFDVWKRNHEEDARKESGRVAKLEEEVNGNPVSGRLSLRNDLSSKMEMTHEKVDKVNAKLGWLLGLFIAILIGVVVNIISLIAKSHAGQ